VNTGEPAGTVVGRLHSPPLCSLVIGLSFNGRTPDSDSGDHGSNPWRPTNGTREKRHARSVPAVVETLARLEANFLEETPNGGKERNSLQWRNGNAAVCKIVMSRLVTTANTMVQLRSAVHQRDVTAAWRPPTPLVRVQILALVPTEGRAGSTLPSVHAGIAQRQSRGLPNRRSRVRSPLPAPTTTTYRRLRLAEQDPGPSNRSTRVRIPQAAPN
jgi:hypothetical protein